MKYVDEFRNADLARGLARAIAQAVAPGHRYNLMEFCGGHTPRHRPPWPARSAAARD
jgi:hydrogenase expression/formation protein HypD